MSDPLPPLTRCSPRPQMTPPGTKHAGHQRALLPNLIVALFLLSMPLLLWSIDTALVTRRPGKSSFASYLLTTATPADQIQGAASPSPRESPAATRPGIAPSPSPAGPSWMSVEMEPNLTSTLLSRWLAPGGQPCRDARTTNVSIPGLDRVGGEAVVGLSAGPVHEFVFFSLDDAGNRRCRGGDYFETDLSGPRWKSRPPVTDRGDGSYSMRLQVHPDFAGDYNLTVVLLFRSFEGLKFSTVRFAFRREVRSVPIRFYRAAGAAASLPPLQLCRAGDFQSRDVWSGRWTRHGQNDQCAISHDGRYRCLDPGFPCRKPWCRGRLGSLESNGWVYSSHCSFALFSQDSAWRCLRGRWLFFWGDSNHVDTIRNLLNFVLGLPEVKSLPRRFDSVFTNPRKPAESVRITSLFNGHANETMNYQGLYSLRDDAFRRLIQGYFSEEDRVPDAVVLNSGLHDGVYWRSLRAFEEGAKYAASFWEEVMQGIRERGKTVPPVFYRTTVATGGYARSMPFNPQKMDAFNGMVVEKLRGRGLLTGGVVDEFDMTFPWHWDNRCSDGVHYGRAPAKARWRDGEVGHQYFVDLMLVHVLLNAFCNGAGGGNP